MDIRRLQESDLALHSSWLFPRLTKLYPHMNDRALLTWFKGIMFSNDFMPLASDTGVALGYISRPDVLAQKPIVQVGFVWVKNRAEAAQAQEAIGFYQQYINWANSNFIDVIYLADHSDVPLDVVKETFKRVLVKETKYLRVKEA